MRHLTKAIERLNKTISKCCKNKNKSRILRLLVVVWPQEPIKKKEKSMDPIELGQIPLGKRIPIDFVPDEPVDVKSDGKYASVEITSGDSTAHVGKGDVEIQQVINREVTSPDATEFASTAGALEPIPVPA